MKEMEAGALFRVNPSLDPYFASRTFHDMVNSPSLLISQSSPGPSPCTAKGRFPLSLTQEDCVLQAWEAGDLSAAGLLAWVWGRPKTDGERVLLSALTV